MNASNSSNAFAAKPPCPLHMSLVEAVILDFLTYERRNIPL